MGDAPPLDEAGAIALHCWRWCAGWNPERWPLYAGLYPVPDWDLLMTLQEKIRDLT